MAATTQRPNPSFKRLLQGRGPVKNHRVSFEETLTRFQNQKLKPILSHRVLIDGRIGRKSGIKQLPWDADFGSRAALHGGRHHFSLGIDEEEFLAVSAPTRLDAACQRNLFDIVKRRK